jgi:diguanylate cyclase (GGDEF)-like protein
MTPGLSDRGEPPPRARSGIDRQDAQPAWVGADAMGDDCSNHVMSPRFRTRNSTTRPSPSLNRIWVTSAVQLLTVVVVLGVFALAATSFSHSLFSATTSQAEQEMSSVTTIKAALIDISIAAPRVMYGVGGSGDAAADLIDYRSARARVYAEFEQAEQIFVDGESEATLLDMIETWQAMDGAILEGPAMLAAGEVEQVLESGVDPYAEIVWGRYTTLDGQLADLASFSVHELQHRIGKADRLQNVILPAVVGAVVLALLLSWAAARRFSRRVLTPLRTLGQAAVAMRESQLDQPVVITDAASELHDLARAINDTSASLRATHAGLRDQAGVDVLTGLPNRRAFTEQLEQRLSGPGRVGVLFIDLDDFKIVNDSLGHAAGDELLRIVADRITSVVRDGETVARLGGDEFAVIVDAGNASDASVALADRILTVLKDQAVIDRTLVSVGCSIGLALSPEGASAEAADELVSNADFAMYMAKSQGKNRFELFAPTMHSEMLAQLELKNDLGKAVALDQFVLEYQPIVQLDTMALLGFEALIRWQHPVRGLLQPAEFIALAEDTDNIGAIGEWVVNEACRALAEHHRQQAADEKPLWVSINASPREIESPRFVRTVTSALERHRIQPRSLIIEITEGVAMTNTDAAALVLTELRSLGVHIALDDFGTGFSSLRSLHELPIDVIKIDRSFLVDIDDDNVTLLELIVTLGHGLGLKVIAEGIETPADLERVKQFGIAGQGYLIARPLGSDDAANFRRRDAERRNTPGYVAVGGLLGLM